MAKKMGKRTVNRAIQKILMEFADRANDAVGHVGMANYQERQDTAHEWIAEAENNAVADLQGLFASALTGAQ